MKPKLALMIAFILVLTTSSMLNAPRPLAAASNRPLPAGSWWTIRGNYSRAASGTGSDQGTYTVTGSFTEKFSVIGRDSNAITISQRHDGEFSCKATGKEWKCDNPSGTYSHTYEYTIALDTLLITAVGKETNKDWIGHPAWLVVNFEQLTEGGAIQEGGWVPNSDGKGNTLRDVSFRVGTETSNVKGSQMKIWTLSYNGDTLGSWRNGDGVYSRGPATETDLYDPVYGIFIGSRFSYSADGVEVGGRGTWTEEYAEDSQLEDTSLSFTVPVTLNVEPDAHVAVTVDGVKYAPDRLPAVFDWVMGTTHSLKVDQTVEGETGVRFVFVQWSDGSDDASRDLTTKEETSLTAAFKTQYELKVVSDIGDPQGAGWYDADAEARISVDSPQPESGLMGSLGAKKVFQEWTGDLTSDSRTETIKMDGPKTVEAKWTTENSRAYVILGGVAAAIVVVLVVAFLLNRRKAHPSLKPAPVGARLTRPPAPRPPPPTVVLPHPPAAVKHCIHCGATIPSVVVFCTECGKKQR